MSNWFPLVLFSAFSLGIYDFCKKNAVKDNPLLPVLSLTTFFGTAFLILTTWLTVGTSLLLTLLQISPAFFCLICIKAVIVGGSWYCGYAALKTIPLSLASPIRATSPLWCTIFGILLYHERTSFIGAIGMLFIFSGTYAIGFIGRKEGFSFRRSKGMQLIVMATLLGAASAIYDKFLINRQGIPADQVQLYFSLILTVLFALLWLLSYLRTTARQKLRWCWSIPATGIVLIFADYSYFHALQCEGAPISGIAVVRRCSSLVSILLGALFLKDRQNLAWKIVIFLYVLLGLALLSLK